MNTFTSVNEELSSLYKRRSLINEKIENILNMLLEFPDLVINNEPHRLNQVFGKYGSNLITPNAATLYIDILDDFQIYYHIKVFPYFQSKDGDIYLTKFWKNDNIIASSVVWGDSLPKGIPPIRKEIVQDLITCTNQELTNKVLQEVKKILDELSKKICKESLVTIKL